MNPTLPALSVRVVPCLADNYAYLIVHPSGHAVVVDPSEALPVLDVLKREGLTLTQVWATHHHVDHVDGIEALLAACGPMPVVGSVYDAQHRRVPAQTVAVGGGAPFSCFDRAVQVLDVPGHTLGAIAFVIDGMAFTGDTLFLGGCGRLFEGDAAMMQASFAKLRALPGDTRVYCGHEYTRSNLKFSASIDPSNARLRERLAALEAQPLCTVPGSIETECATNAFMRWDARAVIEWARSHGALSDSPADVFRAIRLAKDKA